MGRCSQAGTVVLLVVAPFTVYLAVWAYAKLAFLAVSYSFDPRTALSVTIAGCSVFAKPCPESGVGEFGQTVCQYDQDTSQNLGSVRVQRELAATSMNVVRNINTGWLEYLSTEGENDCLAFQSRHCSPTCRVDVYVPQNNTLNLKVDQVKGKNAEYGTLHLNNGLSLDQLTVKGTKLRIEIVNTAIKVKAKVINGAAPIRVVDSRIATGIFTASQGNIRVIYTTNQSLAGPAPDLVKVDYRAATYNDTSVAMSAARVFHRPVEDVMVDCTAGRYLQRVLDTYDGDKNGKITASEFTAGLEKIRKCCGSSCPVYDGCAYSTTPVFVPYGESFVKADDLYTTIRDEADYTIVPYCMRRTWLASDTMVDLSNDTARAAMEVNMDRLTLSTDEGAVQVALWNESGSAPFVSQAMDDAVSAAQAADDADVEDIQIDLGYLRMLKANAAPIFDAIRDPYGNGPIGDTKETPSVVFAVFHVDMSPYLNEDVATASSVRFVYTNEPIYLSVPPAVLSVLSFGLLAPVIEHFRVDFAPSRPFQLGNESTSTRDIIGQELSRILRPRFRTSLWGVLVSIDDASPFHSPTYTRFMLDPATDIVAGASYTPDSRGVLALAFSVTIGFILSATILSRFNHLMRHFLEQSFDNKQAHKIALKKIENQELLQENAAKETTTKLLGDDHKGIKSENGEIEAAAKHCMTPCSSGDGENGTKTQNTASSFPDPLEQPVELCQVLFTDPMRRYFTDSLGEFVDRKCILNEKWLVNRAHKEKQRNRRLERFVDISIWSGNHLIALARMTWFRMATCMPWANRSAGALKKASTIYPCEKTMQDEKLMIAEHKRMEGSVTMSVFLKEFEQFCFKENINMVANVETIKKRLLVEYGVRTRGFMAARVHGCQWKRRDPYDAIRRTMPAWTSNDNLRNDYRARLAHVPDEEDALLSAFVEEYCVVTGDMRDFVSFDDLIVGRDAGANGQRNIMGHGFLTGLQRFAGSISGNAEQAKSINPDDAAFERIGLKRKSVRVETMRALSITSSAGNNVPFVKKISKHAIQGMEIFMLLGLFSLGPILTLYLALSAQSIHATTIGTDSTMHSEDTATLASKRNLRSLDVIWLVEAAAWLSAIFLAVSYILLFAVLILPKSDPSMKVSLWRKIKRKTSKFVFGCSIFALLTMLSMQCVWVILAAFLRPQQFLPMGSALVCFFAVLAFQYGQIITARHRAQKAMRGIFNSKVGARIVEACRLRLKSRNPLKTSLVAIISDSDYVFNPDDLFTLIASQSVDQARAPEEGSKTTSDLVENGSTQDNEANGEVYVTTEADANEAIGEVDVSPEADAIVASEPKADADAGVKVEANAEVELSAEANTDAEAKTNAEASTDAEAGQQPLEEKGSFGSAENPQESEMNDTGAEESLSWDDFQRLFDTLGINVLESKRRMMFAYCDTHETDTRISREEFLNAWDWLVEEIADNVLNESLGLSNFQIGIYLFVLGVVLCLLFAFLLVSMAAFNPAGGFSALIQSGFITSASVLSTGATNSFGAAGAAMNLVGSSEEVDKIVTKEVENRIEPETESA
ncbi:Hypothetical Protein FCC1311_095812 [Hondaea fermentalgiana]|uniref:EF-hand domain-containing protein n=1 Tax=Hondaea fermentalgiana TaxID=2315210 RepID=A0A2R5GUB6_9STRA|nr:Hypothetical Protein FCC1311_095812 [Hondaea fermentalgiana]|eukprot:GBG33358.1 Hypothetical Protein FCC1311_095812 [Hondaea fermentalgiana]